MSLPKADRIAEVVEASSIAFTAQCYELDGAPPLGALVRAGNPFVFAVVSNIAMEPLDPGRRVVARGAQEESEEEVYRSNPQLSRLLCTRFKALIVGHADGAAPRHYLPPVPPGVHAFVYTCAPREVALFTQDPDFLHLLVASGDPGADEVVAACLRGASRHHQEPEAFLVHAGKVLALELAGQGARLNAILKRISP